MEEGEEGRKRKGARSTETREEEAMREEATHSPEEGVTGKCARTDRSDTECGGEAGTL